MPGLEYYVLLASFSAPNFRLPAGLSLLAKTYQRRLLLRRRDRGGIGRQRRDNRGKIRDA